MYANSCMDKFSTVLIIDFSGVGGRELFEIFYGGKKKFLGVEKMHEKI